MIRKFFDLCKHYFKISRINDYELFLSLQKECNTPTQPCPFCKAPCDAFCKDGHYNRDFITYLNSLVIYHEVTIYCVQCTSCGHSHALLSSFLVPYSSYSVSFLLSLLFDYYTKKYKTVALLCEHYEIAISTFYRILRSFLRDRTFLKSMEQQLAYADSLNISSHLYTRPLSNLSTLLQQFFSSYGYSFLQRNCKQLLTLSSYGST